MTLKSIALAGATLIALAAPAAALADPYWGHDRDGWHDRDDWRRNEWRAHERWEARGYGYGHGPRCFVERRGYRDGWGHYVTRPVEVCR
jgi:hypothetical protein